MVQDLQLRRVLSYGPKYREQGNVDWDQSLQALKGGLAKAVEMWAKKEEREEKELVSLPNST